MPAAAVIVQLAPINKSGALNCFLAVRIVVVIIRLLQEKFGIKKRKSRLNAILKSPKIPMIRKNCFMKKLAFIFFFCTRSVFAEINSDLADFIINFYEDPLDNRLVQVEFHNLAIDGRLIESEDDEEASLTKCMMYLNGDSARLENFYYASDFTEEVFLHNGAVYCMEAKNPTSLYIHKRNSSWAKAFMFIPNNLRRVFPSKNELKSIRSKLEQIDEGDTSFFLTWKEKQNTKVLEISKDDKLPVSLRELKPDGNISVESIVSRTDKGLVLTKSVLEADGKIWIKTQYEISFPTDLDFPKDFLPKNFGFREVEDYRWETPQRYLLMDEFPDDKYLDSLFNNPDDLARHNKEIARFNPVKCPHCEKERTDKESKQELK